MDRGKPVIEILTGDFRHLSESLESDTVDLVLTDPPYQKRYLPLWSDLARIAARVLRPGAFLVTYSGQTYLPQVMNMLGGHLQYYWLGGLYHAGQQAQRFEKRIQNAVKPILIYAKKPVRKCPTWFVDLVRSPAISKKYHDWGQSVEPVRYLVERFSEPGALVLDPMLGGGTTAIACAQTGRRFIGYEIDPDVADVARQRLASAQLSFFPVCQLEAHQGVLFDL